MSSNRDYDFSGYVTRYNIRCKDGRTILNGAFEDQDGTQVPLVYQHNHKDAAQVLGHMDLEARNDGIYGYGYLNNTANGQNAKEQIGNGDITSMSIWANELNERLGQVAHGVIKEVSLVLAGANKGAVIDNIAFAHSDGFIEDLPDEAIIYSGEPIELMHDDVNDDEEGESEMDYDENSTVEDVLDTLNEEQAWAASVVLDMAEQGLSHDDVGEDVDMDEVADILNTFDQTQMKAFLAVLGELGGDMGDISHSDLDDIDLDEIIAESEEEDDYDYDADSEDYDDNEDYSQEGEVMHTNVFDQYGPDVLSHDDMNDIVAEAFNGKASSLRDIVISHDALDSADYLAHDAAQYGIGNIEYLFPDARNLDVPPTFIKRDTDWVDGVLNGVHHTPFTRVKSMFADITEDEARARGYIKGNEKKEEFFDLQKRVTEPQTIYKKQKLDRDDILDITDFNVVVWLKQEMRLMLNEEIARAILIGDGRSSSSPDKIKEANIRPIWTDADLFTIKLQDTNTYKNEDERAKAYIRLVLKNRKQLKGSGNPTLFITEDLLTDMLLLEDGIGHTLYDTVDKLATKLRVAKIVSVPVMENQRRTTTIEGAEKEMQIGMILVNLSDYNVGTDKGGEVSMFNDFDIDFNQEKYLMETRISGALVKPKSAMVLEHTPDNIVAG